MIVEVVACEVCEDSAGEGNARYAVLVGGVAAHLHRGEGASGVDHAAQQAVELHGVGSGVFCGYGVGVDDIGYGAYKAGLESTHASQLVEKCCYGGLAVGAGHANESQLVGWVAVET